jgi:two-component system, NarL family, nitrate/nitrite response regulator NarL
MPSDDADATLDLMPISCLIVDDSQMFLAAARRLLEREGLAVVGVATNSAEALREAEASQPEVVLVDVRLGEESGFDLAKRLADDGGPGEAIIIMISTQLEAAFTDQLAAGPAVGFLTKADLSADAIRRIVDGDTK